MIKTAKNPHSINIKVDGKSPLPVYEQIKLYIKLAIISGRLREGDQLIPLRDMSIKLQVNPNTILKVYNQLEAEGYITSRLRRGYFVQYKEDVLSKEKRKLLNDLTSDFFSKAMQLGCSYSDILNEISKAFDTEYNQKYFESDLNGNSKRHII